MKLPDILLAISRELICTFMFVVPSAFVNLIRTITTSYSATLFVVGHSLCTEFSILFAVGDFRMSLAWYRYSMGVLVSILSMAPERVRPVMALADIISIVKSLSSTTILSSDPKCSACVVLGGAGGWVVLWLGVHRNKKRVSSTRLRLHMLIFDGGINYLRPCNILER